MWLVPKAYTLGATAQSYRRQWRRRRGRSLREVFACSRLFATTDLSQICNSVTQGHGTPSAKTQTRTLSRFCKIISKKFRRETTVGERLGQQ